MEGGRTSLVSLLLALIGLASLTVTVSSNCITLDEDDQTVTASFLEKFIGTDTNGRKQYYSYIYYRNEPNNVRLLLGSSDTIYSVDPNDFTEKWSVNIPSRENTGTFNLRCVDLTADEDEKFHCRNQISLIEKIGSYWLVCGTNSQSPACWNCTETDPDEEWNCTYADNIEDVDYFIPGIPDHDSTWLYTDPWAFAGTEVKSHKMAFFTKLDADSNFDTLLTNNADQENWLNTPAFVGDPIEYNGYIYFFFRETATEYVNAGKIIYSRVGRVCKDNEGTSKSAPFKNYFQSMVKARLNCSIDLSFPFYFNEIQDTYVSDGVGADKIIYAAFTTPREGPPASAVCAYSLKEIEHLFNDLARYKGQEENGDDWIPESHSSLGSPEHFGMCDQAYTSSVPLRNAVSNYNLVDQLVPNLRDVRRIYDPANSRNSDSPLLYFNNYRFTTIAKVADDMGEGPIVLMVGTDNKRILKMSFFPNMEKDKYGIKIAEIRLAETNDNNVVNEVRDIVVHEQDDGTYIIATAVSDAFKVKVEFCNIYETCEDCRRVEDPHCYWDDDSNKCKPNVELGGNKKNVNECKVYGGSDDIDVVKSFGDEQSVSVNESHRVNEYSLVVAKKGSKLGLQRPSDTGWKCTINSGATPETEYYSVRLEGDSDEVDSVVLNVTLDDKTDSNITASVRRDDSEICVKGQAEHIYTYDCKIAQYEYEMSQIRQNILMECAKGDSAGGVFQCPSARFEGDSDSFTCPA